MKIQFHKYQGTGNDFIVVDNRNSNFKINQSLIADLCNRKFGIGADGLILLQTEAGYDFRMVYFNADGRESSMCGNGGRCIVFFAQKLGIIKDEARFIAIDGEHKGVVRHQEEKSAFVGLEMKNVDKIKAVGDDWILDTGSPHYVRFVTSADAVNVEWDGEVVRNSEAYREEGINVNFVEKKSTRLYVRTFERGVEAETLSCGTGVVAAAIAAHHAEISKATAMLIKTPGGELEVSFESKVAGSYSNIWLSGPAVCVFSGEILI